MVAINKKNPKETPGRTLGNVLTEISVTRDNLKILRSGSIFIDKDLHNTYKNFKRGICDNHI